MVDKNFTFQKDLKFTAIGGVDEVTKNLFVWEYGHDLLIIDCGIGFPDELSGKEEKLLLPDFSYLMQNRHKIRGLIVTHAHFDHYGAVSKLIEKINIPIYASPLTIEFILSQAKEESHLGKHFDFRPLKKTDAEIKIGCFSLTPFGINHSVPESLGLFINTPVGPIVHVTDFKFDWTPVDEAPFDVAKLTRLTSLRQPLVLAADCLGAVKSGHTDSEANIQEVMENILVRTKGLVLITTVSSNISRIKQAIQAGINVGRKTGFIGRSLEQSAEIAKKLGYFSKFKQHLLFSKQIKNYPDSRKLLIVAGSYGQVDSALTKISQGKHNLVKLKKDDVVIFSADPAPPTVIVNVNKMIDNLSHLGVRVYYYEIQDNLHVSGHGTGEDIKMLVALVRAKNLIPIGGDFRHMTAFKLLAQKMNYSEEQIIFAQAGKPIEFNNYQKGFIVK